MKEGIPIEKGYVLSQDFLEKNEKIITQYNEFFMLYPDLFLETIQSKECPIHLYYYQRILMRAMMRYRYFFGTFTRGTSKSFLAIITEYLSCIFLPGSKRFVVSQFKKASLQITKQKLDEIWNNWPLLKSEILTSHMAADYIDLVFKNGSVLSILSLSASSRGLRETGGTVEEAALVDGQLLSEVIIPMMNVPRKTALGDSNPSEPHAQQKYITSAGSKGTFAYERLTELTAMSCISEDDYFVCGADYTLPVRYGLFDKKSIQDQKMSTSFSSEGFARESLSVWTGGSIDSWFNLEKLSRTRTLLKCERENEATPHDKEHGVFYLIAVDVARTGNNDTSIFVFKVRPRENGWKKDVVYTENLSKMSLTLQGARIKQLNRLYNPKEIVIDGNGVGRGLLDILISPSIGYNGAIDPPIYVFNDPKVYPVPRGEEKQAIIYNMIANAQINSDIYSNLYIQMNGGNVGLLADEKIVKQKLLSTKKGQKMNFLSREKFLLPYIMTTKLLSEMANLKIKLGSANGQITVEQISKRINKDRVSALSYGLYRIKYYEDLETKKRKSGRTDLSKLTLFSSAKKRRH